MTEPSQYFKGRTVQEQMNEVIGYVDVRAEEVAAAKADDVLEPAEQAKDDAIAAKEAAEQARDTTLAALPTIQQDISDLKAEDVALDGRLDNVELRITTAEGNIVTIQGRVTAVETKNSQQDSAIAALQTADANNVKITGANAIGNYAVLLTGNQNNIAGTKKFIGPGQPTLELESYPIWQLKETSVGFNEIGVTAAGLNFYRKGEYSGRLAETTENDGTVTADLMIKSNTESNKEGRLQIYEKTDHTFGIRFWNGSGWTVLVS